MCGGGHYKRGASATVLASQLVQWKTLHPSTPRSNIVLTPRQGGRMLPSGLHRDFSCFSAQRMLGALRTLGALCMRVVRYARCARSAHGSVQTWAVLFTLE